ncbi:MAG TPA: ABC transporter substrate-binding protein [Rhodocyclaceae bacterium]|nr:ABC transporter substrate-binding protein [Rhodocyclaceae bacterium]
MKKLFAFFFACLVATAVWAQEAPDALVKRVSEEVLDIVRKDKDVQNGNTKKILELVDAKVLPYFNFQHMTALAVGKDWRKASPQQQQQLMHEFKTLLVRTYSNALTSYRDQTIRYKPFKMNPGDAEAMVRTEVVQPGGKPTQVDYTLEKLDNGWKVYDVAVAGISLVTNYRETFAQEVRNGGIEGLIQSISNKNKSLEANPPAKAEKK